MGIVIWVFERNAKKNMIISSWFEEKMLFWVVIWRIDKKGRSGYEMACRWVVIF
jgi:hypothetical protein